MKKYKLITSLSVSLLLLNLWACNNRSEPVETASTVKTDKDQVELSAAQEKAIGLQLGHVEMKDLSGAVKANGMLDVPPQNLVSVSAPMAGVVKSTELLQGMRVQKGQVLVTMQHADYIQLQQEFLEVKSQQDYLKAEFERQQELSKDNVNSVKVLQRSKSDYETGLARYAGLRAKLQLLGIDADKLNEKNIQSGISIVSPISGFVTHVNVNIGKFVNPTDVMFTIVDTDHLHAELTVFEKDVQRIRVGQKVRFTLANEQKPRMATVYLVGREIGPDRTVRIHCHLDTEDSNLLPGMYLSAFVEAGAQHVPALPEEAVVNYDGKNYVFVPAEKGGLFRMVKVVTGVTDLGYTEIHFNDRLKPQTKVVVSGAYDLLSQLKNSEEN